MVDTMDADSRRVLPTVIVSSLERPMQASVWLLFFRRCRPQSPHASLKADGSVLW